MGALGTARPWRVRYFRHTLMRSTRVDLLGGRVKVGRNMQPPPGVDAYASGFDSHDPASYDTLYSMWVKVGGVTITYEPTDHATYRWLMRHDLGWLRPLLPGRVRRAWARYDRRVRPETRDRTASTA